MRLDKSYSKQCLPDSLVMVKQLIIQFRHLKMKIVCIYVLCMEKPILVESF